MPVAAMASGYAIAATQQSRRVDGVSRSPSTQVPPDYDGSYTAAEERRRIERGPDLHASRRTQRRVAEMRLGYKL